MIPKELHLLRLAAEREAIRMPEMDRLLVEREADEADDAQGQGERDLAVYSANHEATKLRLIRLAIERTKRGLHQECISCEGVIPDKRLNGLAYAVECVACASDREARKFVAEDWHFEGVA